MVLPYLVDKTISLSTRSPTTGGQESGSVVWRNTWSSSWICCRVESTRDYLLPSSGSRFLGSRPVNRTWVLNHPLEEISHSKRWWSIYYCDVWWETKWSLIHTKCVQEKSFRVIYYNTHNKKRGESGEKMSLKNYDDERIKGKGVCLWKYRHPVYILSYT
jgi:hypothetical protein